MSRARYWNHNTQHHRTVTRLLPAGAGHVLDVGCGDGEFASLLGSRYPNVLAIDTDAHQVALATHRLTDVPNVQVEQNDFLSDALPASHFDLVTALASFHHMPFEQAAAQANHVLKPGGRLVLLDVWTDRRTASDWAWNVGSTAINLLLKAAHGPDHMHAPAMMPTMSLPDVREAAAVQLPGARLQRHLLWRYALVWDKPGGA